MNWPKTLTDDEMSIFCKEWVLVGGCAVPWGQDTMDFVKAFGTGGFHDRGAVYHKIKGLWRRTYADGVVELCHPLAGELKLAPWGEY